MSEKQNIQPYTREELAKVRHYLEGPLRMALKENIAVVDKADIKEGDTILDIGCGTGFLTLEAAKRVGRTGKVIALDMRQEMLDVLISKAEKENLENIITICGLAEDTKLEKYEFDGVIMSYLLHENPIIIKDILSQAVRKVKSGGKVVASDFIKVEDEERNKEIEKWHQSTDPDSEQGEIHFVYTLDNFKDSFQSAGLENVEAEVWYEFHGIISGIKN